MIRKKYPFNFIFCWPWAIKKPCVFGSRSQPTNWLYLAFALSLQCIAMDVDDGDDLLGWRWWEGSEHRLLVEVGIYLIRSPRGHSGGQESTIWEIYYGIGKMGLVNKAIPNGQYGWKTRYILMQVKRHKTESLNWQNFWHEPQTFVRESRFGCKRREVGGWSVSSREESKQLARAL